MTRAASVFAVVLMMLWAGCTPKEQKPNDQSRKPELPDRSVIVAEGQQISAAAFATLSSNLKSALEEKGTGHALQFCHINAMPLVDSLSSNYGVTIRRASHRPRNQNNRATEQEMAVIRNYKRQIKKGEELAPVVRRSPDKRMAIYHAPIRISGTLCLNCHGDPGGDISDSDLALIRDLYPQDEATGFSPGELRGIWTIRFPTAYFRDTNQSGGND